MKKLKSVLMAALMLTALLVPLIPPMRVMAQDETYMLMGEPEAVFEMVFDGDIEEEPPSEPPTTARPTLLPSEGPVDAGSPLALSCQTEDAQIFFTVDGSDPLEFGVLYAGPLAIFENTLVRAVAVHPVSGASEIAQGYFEILPGEDAGESGGQEEADAFLPDTGLIDMAASTDQSFAVSGSFSLPSGHVAPEGGIQFQIIASGDPQGYSRYLSIPAGQSSAVYAMTVATGSYHLSYSIWISAADPSYVRQAYYSAAGMVAGSSQATHLSVSADISGIGLSVLQQPVISGSFSLPSGHVAPTGGLAVEIYASGDPQSYYSSFTIPAGQSSAAYAIGVPTGSYRLGYLINTGEIDPSYVREAYYSAAGMVAGSSQATQLSVSADISGIDLSVLQQPVISGSFSLPSGHVAPAGGIQFQIYAWGDPRNYYSSFTIPAGQSSAVYAIGVLTGSYRLSYSIWTSAADPSYVRQAHYSAAGMVAGSSQATQLSVSADISGIDLSVLQGHVISGNFSLPEGHVAPAGGLVMGIEASGDQQHIYYHSFTIPAGQSSAAYAMTVATGSYRLSYWISSSDYPASYVREAHYSAAGMVAGWSQATQLSVSADTPGIDLAILQGHVISGAFGLPEGDVAPTGGLEIQISASGEGQGYSSSITIPAGQGSASYAMTVATGSYRLRYFINTGGIDPSYVRQAYYSAAGMVAGSSQATQLNVSADTPGIDLSILTITTPPPPPFFPPPFFPPPLPPTPPAPPVVPDPVVPPQVDENGIADLVVPSPEKQLDAQGHVVFTSYVVPETLVEQVEAARDLGATVINLSLGTLHEEGPMPSVKLTIPISVVAALVEDAGLTLTITTRIATLSLPPSLLASLAERGTALTMEISPGAEDEVTERLTNPASIVAPPVKIDTQMVGKTRVLMPVEIQLPDTEIARNAYLDSLHVFAIHSDGELKFLSDIVFEIDETTSSALLKSIEFTVDKFSTFALVQVFTDKLTTLIGTRGYTYKGVWADIAPSYYKANDTMMPVRVLQAFGMEFEWDQSTATTTLTYNGKTIRLTIGSTDAYINGVRTPIVGASGALIAPELAPGRTMIPLRFVSENLGFNVHWDPSNVVTITYKY